MAASSRSVVAGAVRHRLGGDRSDWRGDCDQDADQGVYDSAHLARVYEQTVWLSRRRRRWRRHGALGVVCLARAYGVERCEHDVLVVSIVRLMPVLRIAAGIGPSVTTRMR